MTPGPREWLNSTYFILQRKSSASSWFFVLVLIDSFVDICNGPYQNHLQEENSQEDWRSFWRLGIGIQISPLESPECDLWTLFQYLRRVACKLINYSNHSRLQQCRQGKQLHWIKFVALLGKVQLYCIQKTHFHLHKWKLSFHKEIIPPWLIGHKNISQLVKRRNMTRIMCKAQQLI